MRTYRIRSIQLGLAVAAACAAIGVPSPTAAQTRERRGAPATTAAPGFRDVRTSDAPGEEDGSLYSCAKGRVQRVWVNLKPETELKDLLEWAMTFTCKNFVYSSNIGGRSAKVTIMAPKQMTPQQAWRMFLVSMQTMNLTVVPKGSVLEIVEAPRAKEQPLPVYTRGSVANSDQIVRIVMRPEHMNANDLATALNALKSKDGLVSPLPNAGIVVVTDYGSVIARMLEVVREVDQPGAGEQVYIIKVLYADAAELASKLQEIFGSQGGSSAAAGPMPLPRSQADRRRRNRVQPEPQFAEVTAEEIESAVPSKLIADERTNVLVLLASDAAYQRVLGLVKYLDVKVDGGADRINVYVLENGDAEEVANTLNAVISGMQPASDGRSSSNGRRARQPPMPPAVSMGADAFEGQVRVTHDKATNSLVIIASVKDYRSVRSVIEKLDQPRRQVFIEATIFEVSLDTSRRLGFSFHGGDLREVVGNDDALLFGGVQHSDLATLDLTTLLSAKGFVGGTIGPLLPGAEQLLGISVPSFGVFFQALANNNDFNVLSAPHIIATDNQEAEISVGQNIPYQGAFSGLSLPGIGGNGPGGGGIGGFGIPNVSVQRQDVALTLKMTPHINDSGKVRLEIDQEISDVVSENFNNLGPSWSKRTLKTTVVVGDQESVVIGGLMQDKTSSNESKVPLLGDIPILGYLFKYSHTSKRKTNLLIVLTPYVIREDGDLQRILTRKMEERREFIETFTSFSATEYQTEVDYRRRRGVLEEINRSMQQVEHQKALIRESEQEIIEYPEGPVQYGKDAPARRSDEGAAGTDDEGGGDASPGEEGPADQ
jgi:general secretion pathway protein D